MTNRTLKLLLLLFLSIHGVFLSQQKPYRVSSNNMVKNSNFENDNANDWIFVNSPINGDGWSYGSSLIYGKYIFVDREGTSTATPVLVSPMCTSSPKVVKFRINIANVGRYGFNVKLGNQTLASFINNGGLAQAKMTSDGSVVTSVYVNRELLSEGPVTTGYIANNIWHEVELYVPNYTAGDLIFEQNLNESVLSSRQIRIDDVELYEAIPTPVPTQTSVTLPDCDTDFYDLTTLNPAGSNAYVYNWYSKPDPIAVNQVSDPNQASIGTYYLYATPNVNCGNNITPVVSLSSVAVTVNSAVGCCGGDVIIDGSFNDTDSSDSPTGYLIPKGDNSNGQGVYWKRNFTDNDAQNHIGNYLGLGNAFAMQPKNLTGSWPRAIYQQNAKICQKGNKVIKFKFAVNTQYNFWFNQGAFSIFLTPSVSNLIQQEPFSGVRIAQFYYDGNGYSQNGVGHSGEKWTIVNIASGVTISVNGANQGLNGDNDYQTVYDIEITVPETLDGAYGGIGFIGDPLVGWLVDNVSVNVSAPTGQSPTAVNGAIDCVTGTFNLNTVTPSTSDYNFEWYIDSSGVNKVFDISKVEVGTYYLKTLNCSGCPSDDPLIAFEVINNCGQVSGKIYADTDGVTNGVSNANGDGQSGGLYAILVDAIGNVAGSTKVNSDGTYVIRSTTTGNGFKVVINKDDYAIASVAPTQSVLKPNYFNVRSSEIGSTAYSSNANGISPVFSLSGGATVDNVNFGINFAPIASDASLVLCSPSNPVTVPALHGADDDSNFNDGVGQKVIIKTLNVENNGTLKYDNIALSGLVLPYEIDIYDPTKFVFEITDPSVDAEFKFTYTFKDASGTESVESATIEYYAKTPTVISGNNSVLVSGTTQLIVADDASTNEPWVSSDISIATVDNNGLVTGIAKGKADITFTNKYGCSETIEVYVLCTPVVANTSVAGIDAIQGTTSLDRTGATDGWPSNRKSAYMVIESKTKGFVITRNNDPENTISNPVEGMVVFDTNANGGKGCLKIYSDNIWKCFSTPACD